MNSKGLYFLVLGLGLASGLSFSKAWYYKGKADAYNHSKKLLEESWCKYLNKEKESN